MCPLQRSESPAVPPGAVPSRHRLTIVGEGPGRTEEKAGRPFVGMSGRLLDQLLQSQAHVPRSEVFVTNGALCRGESDRDNAQAAKCCAPRLLSELAATDPKVPIATLGKLSTETVTGIGQIFLARGFVFTLPEIDTAPFRKTALKLAHDSPVRARADLRLASAEGRARLRGRTVLPSVHPAFVLRSETWQPVAQLDARRMGRAVRGLLDPQKLADKGPHVVTSDPRLLKQLGPSVSLDVETTHAPHPALAQLLCVGLSDVGLAPSGPGQTVVLWPWAASMASPLSRFLRSRREVVGHNLITFDRVVLETHGVK